jgi:hypothetical protein
MLFKEIETLQYISLFDMVNVKLYPKTILVYRSLKGLNLYWNQIFVQESVLLQINS